MSLSERRLSKNTQASEISNAGSAHAAVDVVRGRDGRVVLCGSVRGSRGESRAADSGRVGFGRRASTTRFRKQAFFFICHLAK